MPYTRTLLIAAPGSVHALETRIALPSERATHALPERLVLIAPALGLFEPALLRDYTGPLAIAVGSEDGYAPHASLRALLPSAAQLEPLACVDHFFSGSGLARLRAALPSLLG